MFKKISFLVVFVLMFSGFVLAADCTVQSDVLLVQNVQQQACDIFWLKVKVGNLRGSQHMFVDGGTTCAIQGSPNGPVFITPCRDLMANVSGEYVVGTYVTSSDFNSSRISYCFYQRYQQ